ncbi:hypothetical protein HZA39_03680 [Candidatus Peregrinibacteria bacterium]|nr:hypothetical protein [Candidatus Peregrinibacteria bacterium]
MQKNFVIRPEDIEYYKKQGVPLPTISPTERERRRLAFRNDPSLWYRKCDLSGEKILSQYPADAKFPVYKVDYWWEKDYEIPCADYDFERSFFEQFFELKNKVPHMSLVVDYASVVNCDYCHQLGYSKNCYLISRAMRNESCFYSFYIDDSLMSFDCLVVRYCELCYECIDCRNCYNLNFSQNCRNCHDSAFLFDCIGCSDCFCCVNLRRKKYCIFNKEYTKEEYKRELARLWPKSHEDEEKLSKKLAEFRKKFPHQAVYGHQNENSVGNHLYNSKNAFYCFDAYELWDCAYCSMLHMAKDCYDVTIFGDNVELCLECVTAGTHSYNLKFCIDCHVDVSYFEYCDLCYSSKYLFGCIGLRNKSYCILNKQYSKEEYEDLVPRIKAHMRQTGEYGEFFPMKYSPFLYKQSTANLFWPLSDSEIEKLGLTNTSHV